MSSLTDLLSRLCLLKNSGSHTNLRHKLLLAFCLISAVQLSWSQADSLHIPQKKGLFKENVFLRRNIVPASLLVAGIIVSDTDFEDNLQITIRNQVGNDYYNSIDDHLRNIPIAQMYIADIIGIQAKNHWFDQSKNLAISLLITDFLTLELKRVVGKQRPDGTDSKSWPSGHTSHAFATATVLYEEFKHSSPALAYSGYLFAAATGYFRLANNRHYLSDVLAGAGLGILITKLVYKYDYLIPWNPFLKKNQMTLLPRYSEGTVGFHFVKKF